MWLSLFIAVITYLLSPKGTDKEKRQALTNAALAGGATYLATEYTDWGKDLSNSFDSAIGVGGSKTPDATTANNTVKLPTTSTTGGTSWIAGIPNWLTGSVGAAAGVSILGKTIPQWVIWAAIGLGAYWLLKD